VDESAITRALGIGRFDSFYGKLIAGSDVLEVEKLGKFNNYSLVGGYILQIEFVKLLRLVSIDAC
jgi:hypothetical protein